MFNKQEKTDFLRKKEENIDSSNKLKLFFFASIISIGITGPFHNIADSDTPLPISTKNNQKETSILEGIEKITPKEVISPIINDSEKITKIKTDSWKTYHNDYYGFSFNYDKEKFKKLKSLNGEASTLWEYQYRFREKEDETKGFNVLIFNVNKIKEKDIVANNFKYFFQRPDKKYFYALQDIGNDKLNETELKYISETFSITDIKRATKKEKVQKNNNNFIVHLTLGGKHFVRVNSYYAKFVPPPTRSKKCFGNYNCDPDGDKPKKNGGRKFFDDCNLDYMEIPHPACIYTEERWNKVIGSNPAILGVAKKYYLSGGNLTKEDKKFFTKKKKKSKKKKKKK